MATIGFITVCLLISTTFKLSCCNGIYTLKIPQGELFGSVRQTYNNVTYYSFQGIPYAEPPLGDLRFKSPKAAKPWNGVLNATQIRVVCPQHEPLNKFAVNVEENENCLFLHIYTKMPLQLQSVMVYIHGGGFQATDKVIFLDPDYFINENVVFVTFHYRLSVFGFLSIDDPKYDIPGNAGFKDQILALKWIQQNIKYFGGDPNSVTIFGESAGGVSVHLLTLSPLSTGLYNRAISQSGGPTDPWVTSPNTYRELAVKLNCNLNDLKEIIECFNDASTSNFMNALRKLSVNKLGEVTIFNTFVIEKHNTVDPFFAEHPKEIVKSKNYNPVPFIMGFCTDEGLLFVDGFKTARNNRLNHEDLVPKHFNLPMETNLSKILGEKISQVYYGQANPTFDLLEPTVEVLTDLMFFNSIYDFANLQFKMFPKNPIWFYEFRYYGRWNEFPNRTTHADDLFYLFRPKSIPITNDKNENTDEAIGRTRLIKLWTSFAKYGDPNSNVIEYFDNITWKPLEEDKFNYLLIQPHMEIKIADSNYRHLSFWKSLYEAYDTNKLDYALFSVSET